MLRKRFAKKSPCFRRCHFLPAGRILKRSRSTLCETAGAKYRHQSNVNESASVFIGYYFVCLVHLLQFHSDAPGFSPVFRTARGSTLRRAASIFRGSPTIRSRCVCFPAVTWSQFVSSLSSAGNAVPRVARRPRRSLAASGNIWRQHLAQLRATCCVDALLPRRRFVFLVPELLSVRRV